MTTLVWDQVGERRYETGIDRGVIYLKDGSSVPWNGLTSVVESQSRDIQSYYIDGIKYLDYSSPGAYSAKLQAFTYPDELDVVLGNGNFAPGVVVHDQKADRFNLSYRTRLANDIQGTDFAYKIHIVYNVTASPGDADYETLSSSVTAKDLAWDLRGVPNQMFGIRPTCHISLNSRTLDPVKLADLEALLYGTVSVNPALPGFIDLLEMLAP